MKTKQCWVRGYSVIAAMMIFIAGTLSGCQRDDEIPLKDLKSGDEYQYVKAAWNASAEEVEKNLPYSIEKDSYKTPESGSGQYIPYKTEKIISVDGYQAEAGFEFYEDELKVVNFRFRVQDSGYREQFAEQVEHLIQQFGQESEKVENSGNRAEGVTAGMESVTYRWDTENTTLQFGLVTGSSIKPTIQLALAHKSVFEEKYREMIGG